MPSRSAVYCYLAGRGEKNLSFRRDYEACLAILGLILMDEILAIADGDDGGLDERRNENGEVYLASLRQQLARDRERIKVRMWQLSRVCASKYWMP